MGPVLKTLPVVVLVVFGIILPSGHPSDLPLVAAEGAPGNTFSMDWQAILGTAGVTGVLVWYLWYTTSTAFPKVRDDFRQEMAAERQHHETLVSKTFEKMDALCDELSEFTEELRSRPCLAKKKDGVVATQ